MGDDGDANVNAEGCYVDLYDANGDELKKVKRKKKTMCPNIYERKPWKGDMDADLAAYHERKAKGLTYAEQ